MRLFRQVAIFSLAATVLWGCETAPEEPEEAAPEAVEPAERPAAEEPGVTTRPGEREPGAEAEPMITEPMKEPEFEGHPLDDPDSLLSKRTIYFAFDESEVQNKYRDIVATHAEYLANNPSASVTIEGHADERGTREYNIGLGERRANAVRQMLILQGASPDQISTISYGEERPVALGHNEDAWGQNRRAEIVYTNRG